MRAALRLLHAACAAVTVALASGHAAQEPHHLTLLSRSGRRLRAAAVSSSQAASATAQEPGESYVLSPDWNTMQWTWTARSQAAGGITGSAPALNRTNASSTNTTGPAANNLCSTLQSAAPAGHFLECREFRYYGSGVFGRGQPYGCHCAAWSVNCPFELCSPQQAWEDQCLDTPATDLGFVSFSKLPLHVPAEESIPPALRPFQQKTDYISTCMYWLPKPPAPQMPTLFSNASTLARLLPDFATLWFWGIGLEDCGWEVSTEANLVASKDALLSALNQQGLEVLSITCGNQEKAYGQNAVIKGPWASVERAEELAGNASFCYNVSLNGTSPYAAPAWGSSNLLGGGAGAAGSNGTNASGNKVVQVCTSPPAARLYGQQSNTSSTNNVPNVSSSTGFKPFLLGR